MTEETRTIIVERKNGDIFTVSDIPGDAKITFGPLAPGSKSHGWNQDGAQGGTALRIYNSRDDQLGVFTGVACFRDTRLKIRKREVNVDYRSKVKASSKTGEIIEETSHAQNEEVVWVDPDEDIAF